MKFVRDTRKVYEAVTKDISQKMIGVNESLKKINEASAASHGETKSRAKNFW